MVFIFEGMDNCLKDTIIQMLRTHLSPATQVLKFSNPPKNIDNPEGYQRQHFADMFNLLALSLTESNRNLILNRAHLGEYVYSPIYRNYEADWIFDLESEYLMNAQCLQNTKLILLLDTDNEQLKLRDDGRSMSQTDEAKFNAERKKFLEAFDRSSIQAKIKFDLSNYYLPGTDPTKRIDLLPILNKILELKSQD